MSLRPGCACAVVCLWCCGVVSILEDVNCACVTLRLESLKKSCADILWIICITVKIKKSDDKLEITIIAAHYIVGFALSIVRNKQTNIRLLSTRTLHT